MDINEPCPCTVEGFCPHFRRNLVGKDWGLAQMRNDVGRAARQRWLDEMRAAEAVKEVVAEAPKKSCQCAKARGNLY